jgi:prepilin-type N-terminal cleavage/methylation domain-containing protein
MHRNRQRGLSLVELMVGITVGLIVAAATSMVAVNQINEHRRLMLEVQIQQDLRTAADLLQQDMRRAGYRGLAQYSVWQPASGVGTTLEIPAQPASASPYSAVQKTDDLVARTLTYSYASTPDNADDVPFNNEYFGIRWDKATQVLSLKLGLRNGQDNWQPITDPESVKIIGFDINVASQSVDIKDFCDKACTGSNCPTQAVRSVSFTIRGQAKHDSNVIRTLEGVERIRADAITGVCPT